MDDLPRYFVYDLYAIESSDEQLPGSKIRQKKMSSYLFSTREKKNIYDYARYAAKINNK